MIEGRGLFYGAAGQFGRARIFTQQSWDAACHQAADCGIQWVHPKVADGAYWWYCNLNDHTKPDSGQLGMLRDVAHHYGLKVGPYNWCWGAAHGQTDWEAQITGTIANFFDAACPDMESEWDNQHELALHFGTIVRQVSPHGLVVPTLFANPRQHPTPYLEISRWASAWMPQVYFSEWTTLSHQDTALNAIDYVYPQWMELNQHLHQAGVTPLPILPIIELGSALPPQEVYNWLHKMVDYGYCGFWYDGTYPPYASTIKSAPVPAFPHQQPQPEPVTPPPPAHPYQPVILSGPGLAFDKGENTMNQHMTEAQLKTIWDMGGTNVPFTLAHGIPATWAAAMEQKPDTIGARLGSPLHDEIGLTLNGEKCTFIDFSGGGRLTYFFSSNSVVFSPSPRISTQTVVTPAVQVPPAPAPVATNGVVQ